VRQQIEERKFPVVDPYRTPMSKSDVDQLRFEIDQDIPPYDPSLPPSSDDEPRIPIVLMAIETDYAPDDADHENTYRARCVIYRNATPELFERLKPYFMSRRQDGTFFPGSSPLSFEPLSNVRYEPSDSRIRSKRSTFMDTMRLMDLPVLSQQAFRMRQENFHYALHEVSATLMRELLENGGYMTPTSKVFTMFSMDTETLTLRWKVTDLRNEFFEAMDSEFREILPTEAPEFLGQDLFRSTFHVFRDVFQDIISQAGFQMSPMPRSPIFENHYFLGTIDRFLDFGVVPRPRAEPPPQAPPEPQRGWLRSMLGL
jgi:hypothetical protein